MKLCQEYQRRMASLARAEAGRFGPAPLSYSSVALARRMVRALDDKPGGVDPVRASVSSAPFLLQA